MKSDMAETNETLMVDPPFLLVEDYAFLENMAMKIPIDDDHSQDGCVGNVIGVDNDDFDDDDVLSLFKKTTTTITTTTTLETSGGATSITTKTIERWNMPVVQRVYDIGGLILLVGAAFYLQGKKPKPRTAKQQEEEPTRFEPERQSAVIVEDADDDEEDDEYKSPSRNRRPSPGCWMEPVEEISS